MTPSPSPGSVVDNARSEVFWLKEGVLGIRIKGPCSLDGDDAEALFTAFDALGVVVPTPLVADIRGLRGVTLGVRTRMASERAGRYLASVALIADNPLTRMIGNFFMRLNQPPFPLRIFDDEVSALAWLADEAGQK